ncbi:MAG TPA: hypothetical protein VIJ33_04940 [Solirubrobacteraceae bacterium]
MSIAVVVLTLVLLAAVIAVVSGPLLAVRKPTESQEPRRDELEAAREAKYREIRDVELDYRTGKLSREDFEAVNGTLRAEAIEILNRLESLEREKDGENEPADPADGSIEPGSNEPADGSNEPGSNEPADGSTQDPGEGSPGGEKPISRVP